MKRFSMAVVLGAAAFISGAQTKPVTIDFTQKLVGVSGAPILLNTDKASLAATLGDVAVNALEIATDQDRAISGGQKFQRDELARKIYHQKAVALSVEDVALIKERIGEVYGPLVIGAAWPLLDPSVKAAR